MLTAVIVGYGERGETLTRILRTHFSDQVKITAIVDPNVYVREVAHKQVQVSTYEDLVEVFSDVVLWPDIVIIATNPPLHCEQVITAANYGCAIFCEKPLALSPIETDRMVAAVRRSGVPCTVDFETVFADSFHVLQAYLGSEGFGDLLRFDAVDKGRPPAYDIETCMPHFLHAMMQLTGSKPVEVFARVLVDGRRATLEDVRPISELYPQGRTHDIGLRADTIEASYLFENGVTARFFLSALDKVYIEEAGKSSGKAGSEFMHFVCYGTRGQIKFHQTATGSVYIKSVPQDTPGNMTWQPVPVLWQPDPTWITPTTRLMRDFLNAVEDGRRRRKLHTTLPTIEDAALVVDMTSGIYASHLANMPVVLPLVNRKHPLK